MTLKHSIAKEIEAHFYNYQQEKETYESMVDAIASGMNFQLDPTGGIRAIGTNSDQTFNKVMALDRQCENLRLWIKVVEYTYHGIGNELKEFMIAVYKDRLSPLACQDKFYMREATYYRWKQDILNYAALIACELGVLKVLKNYDSFEG